MIARNFVFIFRTTRRIVPSLIAFVRMQRTFYSSSERYNTNAAALGLTAGALLEYRSRGLDPTATMMGLR